DQIQFVHNAISGTALDLALKPSLNSAEAAAGLSQHPGPSGPPVPIYNLFSVPGHNDPATIDSIRTTLFSSGKSQEWDALGVINGTPLELSGGPLGVAIGGGYTEESLETDFDDLTRHGKDPGLNAALPTS